jgi:hypothetical protein
MFFRIVLLGFVLCVSMPASAQETSRGASPRTSLQKPAPSGVDQQAIPPGRKVWDHEDEPGAWIPWEMSCTPVERPVQDAWEKQLKAIAALVRACPVFHDIRGYYPMLVGCVQRNPTATGPYNGSVALLIWPPVTVEHTPTGEPRVRDVWRYNGLGGLWITLNSIGDLGFDWFNAEDSQGRFYELPETQREIAGFPVIGRFLSISLPNKPPRFTPITQERAQRWIIDNLKRQASADASILASASRQYEEFVSPAGKARRAKAIEDAAATLKKPEDQAAERRRLQTIDQRRERDLQAATVPKAGSPEAHTAERVTQLEARLAAMSPEQRQQPAWYKRPPEGVRRLDYGDIVDAGSSGARPLVVPNPGFFDPALPKTAMQLVVTLPDDRPTTKVASDPARRLFQAFVEQMDWKAVAAMLK